MLKLWGCSRWNLWSFEQGAVCVFFCESLVLGRINWSAARSASCFFLIFWDDSGDKNTPNWNVSQMIGDNQARLLDLHAMPCYSVPFWNQL